MAISHSKSGEVIELPLGAALETGKSTTLVKTEHLELIRLVLPAGREIPTHKAPGEITVQCLEGRVAFTAHGKTEELVPGQMLYLAAGEPHAVKAFEPSAVLVTMLLKERQKQPQSDT